VRLESERDLTTTVMDLSISKDGELDYNPDESSMTSRAYEFLADVTYDRFLVKRYFKAMKRHVSISQEYRILQPRLRYCLFSWLQYSRTSLSLKQSTLKAMRHFRLVTLSRAFAALNALTLRARRERQRVIYSAMLARKIILEKAFQVWVLSASTCRLEREWNKRAEIHFYCIQAKRSLIQWRQWKDSKRKLANARIFAINKTLRSALRAWKCLILDQKHVRSVIEERRQKWRSRLICISLNSWRSNAKSLHLAREQDEIASLYYTSRILRACIYSWRQISSENSSFIYRALLLQKKRFRSQSFAAISKWRGYTRLRQQIRQEQQRRDKETFIILRRFHLRRSLSLWRVRHKERMDLAMIEAAIRFNCQCHLLRKCLSALILYRKWQQAKHEQQLLAKRFNAMRLLYAGWSRWRFAFKRSIKINQIGLLVASQHSSFLLKVFFKNWKNQVVRKRHLAEDFLIGVRSRTLALQDERQHSSSIHEDFLLFPSSSARSISLDPFTVVQDVLRDAENKLGDRSTLKIMHGNIQTTSKGFLSIESISIQSPLGGEPRQTNHLRRLPPPRPLREDNVNDAKSSVMTLSSTDIPPALEKLSMQGTKESILNEEKDSYRLIQTSSQHLGGQNLGVLDSETRLQSESKDDLRLQIETLTALIKIREDAPSFSSERMSLVLLLQDLKEREKVEEGYTNKVEL
jgi:hypothetical protein